MKNPKYIYRIDDGFRFSLQKNGFYVLDLTMNARPSLYSLKTLSGPAFTTDKNKIKIIKIKDRNDGHGNEDFGE